MKCPACSHNHSYSGGMVCKCGYQFVLDPKQDGIADRRFVAFIRAASCNGTFFYTENQLYTAACRKQISAPLLALILAVAGFVFFLFMSIWHSLVWLIFLLPTTIGLLSWPYVRFVKQLPRKKFDDWLRRYTKGHGPIEGLVQEGQLVEPPEKPVEPDIFDYGVERVLIVQRSVLVDLLVANNLHSTNRAVIMTSDGYPSYIRPRVKDLLNESNDLPVYLLHDATKKGVIWAKEQQGYFESLGRSAIDMGLHPESLEKISKLNTLRLKKTGYEAPIDVLPMAMLANGIALSMDQKTGMDELLVAEISADSSANFG